MISQALVWIGEHGVAVGSLGIAAIAIGLAMYLARDLPPPLEPDEHARHRFIG